MAVRASMALPGIFTPVRHGEDWLVDGGLVNPVPVSLCHAMGAERVIAVNLSDGLLGRHVPAPESQSQLAKFAAWFDRGAEAIKEGEQAVARLQPAIEAFKQRL